MGQILLLNPHQTPFKSPLMPEGGVVGHYIDRRITSEVLIRYRRTVNDQKLGVGNGYKASDSPRVHVYKLLTDTINFALYPVSLSLSSSVGLSLPSSVGLSLSLSDVTHARTHARTHAHTHTHTHAMFLTVRWWVAIRVRGAGPRHDG